MRSSKIAGVGILALLAGGLAVALALIDIYNPRITLPGTLLILLGGIAGLLVSIISIPAAVLTWLRPLDIHEFAGLPRLRGALLDLESSQVLEPFLVPGQRDGAKGFYRGLQKTLGSELQDFTCISVSARQHPWVNSVATITAYVQEVRGDQAKSKARLGLIAVQSNLKDWYLAIPNLDPPASAVCLEAEKGPDPLLEDAARIRREANLKSTLPLERRLGIGHGRAEALVEQLREAGLTDL